MDTVSRSYTYCHWERDKNDFFQHSFSCQFETFLSPSFSLACTLYFPLFYIWIWVIKYISSNEEKKIVCVCVFLFVQLFLLLYFHLNYVVIAVYICIGRLFFSMNITHEFASSLIHIQIQHSQNTIGLSLCLSLSVYLRLACMLYIHKTICTVRAHAVK